VAVNEATGLVVGKEGNRAGDVVRPGKAAHRDTAGYVRVGVAAAGLVGSIHFCFYPAGANGVDAYTATAPFRGKRTRKTDQAVFRSVVRRSICYGN
jgi:hypothetical protein